MTNLQKNNNATNYAKVKNRHIGNVSKSIKDAKKWLLFHEEFHYSCLVNGNLIAAEAHGRRWKYFNDALKVLRGLHQRQKLIR